MTIASIGVSAAALRTMCTCDEFEAVEDRWRDLTEVSSCASPFLLHGWLAERWRRVGDALVVTAWRGEHIVAALPLTFVERRGLHVAEFLAGPYAGLDVLLAEGEPVETAARVLDVARRHAGVLEVFGLGDGSVFARAWRGRLPLLRLAGAPMLSLREGWDAAYVRRTSAKSRNQLRRRLRRLEELGAVEFTTARMGTELDEALEQSFRLHELRWRTRRDADLSGYASEGGRVFHRRAAQRLARDDVPRITLLRVDGRAIAFHYWLSHRGVMTVHRLAFDPAYGDCSPGLLATHEAIAQASAEGCTEVAFLRGEDRYKLELADRVEPVYWTAAGRPIALLRRAELASRQRLKRARVLHRLYDRTRR
jgi:CelD/BcsL family acetyltransferase involved in cellulose biosynthesis